MSRWRAGRTLLWVVLGLVVVLLGARLAAPSIVAKVVRKSLMQLKGGYYGEIDDVDLSVLTGEVHILGMRIIKANHRVPVPFMQIERFTLEVVRDGWAPRMALHLYRPNVNLVDAKNEAAQQWGPDFKLTELREKLPAELTSIDLEDGQVHFRNFEARPKIDAAVHKLDVSWTNLDGCLPPGWPTCRSQMEAKAGVLGSGNLAAQGRYDRHEGSHFRATANLRGLKAEQLNPVLLKYAKIDVQDGRVDVEAHVTQNGEAKRLVLVPRLYDMKIAGSDNERTKWVRDAVAGAAAGWFERQRGEKAIAYKKPGKGAGEWSLIDWNGEHSSAPKHPQPYAEAK